MSKMLNLSEDKVVYGPTDSDGKMLGTSDRSFCPLSKLWSKSPQTEFSGRGRERFF